MKPALAAHLVLLAAAACGPSASYGPPTPTWVSDTQGFMPGKPAAASTLPEVYRSIATRIILAARDDKGAYAKLAELTDGIGNRASGSASLDKAIAWAAQRMKDDGLDARTEPVSIPVWQRGVEEAAVIAPIARPLTIIGLGGSVATPKGGITAPVVVVHDGKELEAKSAQVKGAIVVYNVAMAAWKPGVGSGYGDTYMYRSRGAARAAQFGAVASLTRSLTATSLGTPHTGGMRYDGAVSKIPTAALTVEDAELLDRLSRKGPVSVRLRIDSQTLPDVQSANVIGELRGTEKADEVVLLAAHIDSWDVGQGAHDDGAGCVVMMQALAMIKRLGLTPRRTIRVVLFTNEEFGGRGGKVYADMHAAELGKTVFAVESDGGGYAPTGFTIDHVDRAARGRMRTRLTSIASLLRDLGATQIAEEDDVGSDIGPMKPAGVPQASLEVASRTYFDYHHSAADTLDKVNADDLAAMAAATAVMAYVIADMPDRIDAP
jgi:carboxypeptidase Q